MQNFPLLDTSSGSSSFFDVNSGSKSGHGAWTEDFANVFRDVVNTDHSSAKPEKAPKQVNASQKVQKKEQVTEQDFLDEKITEEDFAQLKQILKKHGVSGKDIQKLEEKFEASGLTWKELISSLDFSGLNQATSLNANDKKEIMNFLSKLGFNSQEVRDLLNDFKAGRHDQVWEKISLKMENLPDDARFSLSQNQVQSLLKVLGIDSQKTSGFASFVGKELGKSELNNFLAMIKKEATTGSINQALKELVLSKSDSGKPALSSGAAALLADISRLVQKGESNEQSSDRVRELAFTKSKKENAPQGILSGNQDGKADKQAKNSNPAQNANHEKNSQSDNNNGQSRHGEKSLFDRLNDSNSPGKQADAQDKSKEDPWDKFLSKIRTSESNDSRGAVLGQANAKDSADALKQKSNLQHREFVSRQVLDQVQNGMFKRLSEGRTQITLQLDPPALGRVAVVLQMHDKEVRAMIRPSSPEVAQIVSENMAKLKASLEQQGLRVNKIEVQTQMQQGHGQTWQGQEEHNKARDKMREAIRIARMRGLDGAGKAKDGVDGAILMNPETRDGPGLDLFA
ncbi:MAG: hypothetical protein D5R98_06065 [Desulfonatronovibrio sp. MSAO_Bac4]|nr:MAG: hypothetical protein D5R98_06065 [Desulfonatronovibrio sp. MSAO_Bac4]